MKRTGYYAELTRDIRKTIAKNFTKGAVIEVKHVRKIAHIDNRDRSKIIFLSRVLHDLEQSGMLSLIPNTQPKQYVIQQQ